jgi:riboflavin kinase / FMN adenylyltransferase
VVTIGTFDGVHIGHKKIIERITESASQLNCESLLLTFFPHPRLVLHEGTDIKLLNTIDEKTFILDKLGLDNLIIHPFDKEFSRLTAEEFIKDILVDKFKVLKIIIGYDHRFGRNRTANIEDLIEFGNQFNFDVEQISAEEISDVSISSTKIRTALLEGNIGKANNYLGYDYIISGKVIKGKQLGRTIDFPTANIKIKEDYKLIPPNGVYIVKSELKNKTVFGMMNIGTNPTVKGTTQSIEVHFFDFKEDLYDQKITVSIINKIREEIKFNSVEDLKKQLQSDRKTSLSFFNK